MANEITARASLSVAKNAAAVANDFTITATLAGTKFFSNIQNIGTTAEALDFNDLATANLLLVKNLDATNYVEIALDSGLTYKFAKLPPGEFLLLRPTTATLYAKANTAAVNVLVLASEA